jgi:hypothetical protein
MAVKAGQIIHVGNGAVLVDRIQTGGPGTVNVPVETIYELGNYKSIGQVRDIPDLSFSMESYDVSEEIEALLLGLDPTAVLTTDVLDPANARPVDMKSVFKAGQGAAAPFDVVNSVGLPYLTLESLSYRFGLRDDARQTATLRGDSIYYNPGSTYIESAVGTGVAGQTVVTAHPAYGVDEGGVFRRILGVTAGTRRLTYGVDYTETYGAVTAGAAVTTVHLVAAVPATDDVRIMYSSPTAETLNQSVHAPVSATKPAAIRGRDIAVYLGGYDSANPYTNRLLGVQAVTADWRVNLEKDEEFGNYHFVSQDYDVPTVSGTVQVKPVDPAAMFATMQELAGITDVHKSATANTAPVVPLDVVLHSPVDGSVLKRISVPDARFTVPGFSAQVQQKLSFTINWNSDTGEMLITGE